MFKTKTNNLFPLFLLKLVVSFWKVNTLRQIYLWFDTVSIAMKAQCEYLTVVFQKWLPHAD